MNDLPLFAWQPLRKLIVFPLTAREVGRQSYGRMHSSDPRGAA